MPLLIKAIYAWGETGWLKRKWSAKTEHVGSKHLMGCPACWANKLFKIERNSRQLNRVMWNISPVYSVSLETKERRHKNKTHLASAWCKLTFFICNQFLELNYSCIPCQEEESQRFESECWMYSTLHFSFIFSHWFLSQQHDTVHMSMLMFGHENQYS